MEDWLRGPMRSIYELFKNLDPAERQQISGWYQHNPLRTRETITYRLDPVVSGK
jgi:hypothetical protein